MTADQIARDLAERVRKGEYPPGSQMPPYRVLADLYSVSFSTIARVMTLLRERGVVVGVPGRGTFVAERAN
jgi:GntR family transcriptional regulator